MNWVIVSDYKENSWISFLLFFCFFVFLQKPSHDTVISVMFGESWKRNGKKTYIMMFGKFLNSAVHAVIIIPTEIENIKVYHLLLI